MSVRVLSVWREKSDGGSGPGAGPFSLLLSVRILVSSLPDAPRGEQMPCPWHTAGGPGVSTRGGVTPVASQGHSKADQATVKCSSAFLRGSQLDPLLGFGATGGSCWSSPSALTLCSFVSLILSGGPAGMSAGASAVTGRVISCRHSRRGDVT